MNVSDARHLAIGLRHNIGSLLYRCRDIKRHPDNFTVGDIAETCRYLYETREQLKNLYEKFPEIKPARGRQMKLKLEVA